MLGDKPEHLAYHPLNADTIGTKVGKTTLMNAFSGDVPIQLHGHKTEELLIGLSLATQ